MDYFVIKAKNFAAGKQSEKPIEAHTHVSRPTNSKPLPKKREDWRMFEIVKKSSGTIDQLKTVIVEPTACGWLLADIIDKDEEKENEENDKSWHELTEEDLAAAAEYFDF